MCANAKRIAEWRWEYCIWWTHRITYAKWIVGRELHTICSVLDVQHIIMQNESKYCGHDDACDTIMPIEKQSSCDRTTWLLLFRCKIKKIKNVFSVLRCDYVTTKTELALEWLFRVCSLFCQQIKACGIIRALYCKVFSIKKIITIFLNWTNNNTFCLYRVLNSFSFHTFRRFLYYRSFCQPPT